MIKNKFLFALILLSLNKIILPQGDLQFEKLSLQEGVAHNLTYSMIKDSRGFLWFGTMYGLARYEGTGYTIFKHNPEDHSSISFDDIVSLYEDKNGNIWIGTWGGGLNKYNPYEGKFTRYVFQKDNPDGINDNIVWAITEDKDGNIWLGTERGGLNKYDPLKNKFVHYTHNDSDYKSISSNSVQSLLYDSKGNLWIGTKAGLSKFNFTNNTFENFINNPDNEKSISRGMVKVIYEDSKKNLWVGTSSGLNKINGNTFDKYTSSENPNSLSSNFITCITENDSGLWIGTGYGLNYFEPRKGKFTRFRYEPSNPFSLSGNSVHNIVIDNAGLLWINIYNSGINKQVIDRKDNFLNLSYSSDNNLSLSSKNVLSLTEGKDYKVWIGTNSGLNSYNPEQHTVIRIYKDDTPARNFISALATDFDGNIWVGTQAGLRLFNPYSQRFSEPGYKGLKEAGLFSSYITSLLVDSLTVWIGTYSNGLFRLDREKNSLSKFSFEGKQFNNYQADYILSLYKDRLGRIWIGSYGGLTMFSKKDNSFKSYTNDINDKTTLSNNYIFTIYEDSRNDLWVGTANGLNKYIFSSATFKHYFEKDGLPNSVICSIVEDFNNDLWISTNKGITKFNVKDSSFTNYDISDGLGGNLFNTNAGLYGTYTNVMFGGNWGCLLFYPGEMSFSEYNPPVRISSLKKNNSDGSSILITSFNDKIEISGSKKNITLSFASLDFSKPFKNKYIYKLKGVDNKWISAGNNNSATYTNLEPGEYLFEVKGTNSDGIFSDNFAQLKLIVVPSFWQTFWFKLLMAVLLVAAIIFFVRYRIKTKIKKEIEFQKIREEEATKIRKQTAIDFHDELGHRLTRISLLAEMIRKKLHNAFIEIDPMLKNISENSHRLYEGTKDFIWAIDPDQDNLYDLIVRLKDFGDELFNRTEIKFSIKGLEESLQKYPVNMEWKRQIPLIFKEAMNNALKYSECKSVTLEIVLRDENKAEIFLFDDGKGFNIEKVYEGNGLKNMKNRGEKLGGFTEIDSRPTIGTKVLFKGIIPVNYIDYTRRVA